MCFSSKQPAPQAPPTPPSARDADQEAVRARQVKARNASGIAMTDVTQGSLADEYAPTAKPTLGA